MITVDANVLSPVWKCPDIDPSVRADGRERAGGAVLDSAEACG